MGPEGVRREQSSGVGLPGGMTSGDSGSSEPGAGRTERQQLGLRTVHALQSPSRSEALGGRREGCRCPPPPCSQGCSSCSVRSAALPFCSFPCEARLQRGARSCYGDKTVAIELKKGFRSLGCACSHCQWWMGGRRLSWEELDLQSNRPQMDS